MQMDDEPTAASSNVSTSPDNAGPSPPRGATLPRLYQANTNICPVPRTYFPSSESLASSALWSSTEGSSNVNSGESEMDSASNYSSESSAGSFDEEELRDILSPRHFQRPLFPTERPAASTIGGGSKDPVISTANSPAATTALPPMGLSFGGPEGLPFTLESLKRDLEKVGRAIITSNAGEIAAERAQTLASINWLASHVPNAVLDKLGHEIRAAVDQSENGDEEDSRSEGSTFGVDRVTDIISDDDMSEVSELSNHEDEPSYEEEETMRMVEPADVSNVGISYGDLATFAMTQASPFLPEDEISPTMRRRGSGLGSSMLPEIDEINPCRTPLHRASMSTLGSLLNELPMKFDKRDTEDKPQKPISTSSILDMIPTKRGHESSATFTPRKNSMSTVTTASSTTSVKQTRKKGVKGLLRRFRKGKSTKVDGTPPSPPMSPLDVQRRKSPTTPDSTRWYKQDFVEKKEVEWQIGSSGDKTIERTSALQGNEKKYLPYSTKYRCALLFVDISGFTKLSRLLDPESLSRVRISTLTTFFQNGLFSYSIVFFVITGNQHILSTHCRRGSRWKRRSSQICRRCSFH